MSCVYGWICLGYVCVTGAEAGYLQRVGLRAIADFQHCCLNKCKAIESFLTLMLNSIVSSGLQPSKAGVFDALNVWCNGAVSISINNTQYMRSGPSKRSYITNNKH